MDKKWTRKEIRIKGERERRGGFGKKLEAEG